MKRLIVATRKSALALAQARAWMDELRSRSGADPEELHVTTTGDRIQDVPLASIGGKGLFIKEIEEALLEGRADLAVHSMKDVPAELAPSLVIGCIPVREDPRDALVTRDGVGLAALPPGSRVGTSSLRRATLLRKLRPDLAVVPLRGNVDTRLRKCAEGAVDAIVLAAAGLRRLGLGDRATELLDPSICLPAVGQGALAIECRASDVETRALLERLSHAETARAVSAERGVMRAVDGSCQIPVAAHAWQEGERFVLRAMLANPDGSSPCFDEVVTAYPGTDREAFLLGEELGKALRARVRSG